MTSPQVPPGTLSSPPHAPSPLTGLPFVVVQVNRSGLVEAVSDAWPMLSGHAALNTIGTPWDRYLEAGDQEAWSTMARDLYEGNRTLGEGIVRLRREDGARRTVELRCALQHDSDGASDGLGILVVDVTGREPSLPAMRRAVRLTEESTRSLVERAAFGIFRCTPDGVLLDVNPAMATMLGYTGPEPLLGRNLFEQLQPGAGERERCLAELARGTPEVFCDLRGPRRNGATVHLRLAVTAEFDGRQLCFLQGMAENITERARREEIVRRGERMASLTRTLAGVAHEINNPLAAITGFAQILLKRDQPDDERHAHETILHEARRAAQIIKDLLTIARRQEGSERVRVDVNAIVRYLIDTQRYAMDTRGIVISVQLATDAPLVQADPAQVEQVVLNLLVNARQALESRLETRLDSRGGDDDWRPTLEITTSRSQGRFVIAVIDNGPGIPAQDLPHVWDPFWTTREEGEGSGLGLAVVHGIVETHGGTIEATSVPGIATTFTVTLPGLSSSSPSSPSSPLAPRVAALGSTAPRPLDILVVDDEMVIRELLARYFTTRGHAVVAAANAEQALRLAEQGSFDVIISDLRMPGMDGRALIRRLRTLPSCGDTRFILSTGDTTAIPGPSDVTEPVVEVVTKPYDVDALVAIVEGR
ncbi:MAG: ATP-binding protein [Gemmatimonadota bacterium]